MKKLFGKRAVALLTTMAILVSLVAMLSGLSLTSNAAYEPKRVMSYTAGGTQVEGKMIITASGTELGAGIETVIKGYYKVENYKELTGDGMCVQIAPDQGGPSVTANCDWTAFSVNYTTGDSNWVKFGFWFTQGTLSIADITIEKKDGTVIYDMATDTKLVAGTYDADKQPSQQGLWYIGYYGDKSEISCTVGPVYVPSYEPKRVMSYTAGGTQVEGKMIITASGTELGAGIETVIKGYYKVENYKELTGDGMCVQIAPDQGGPSVTANCGWTPFSVNYTTGDSNWVKFGFWFTQGTLSIADITIEKKDGTVIYDMTTDTKLVAGTYGADKQPSQQGLWYIGYYGDKSEISCTVGPAYVPPYEPKRVMSYTAGGTQVEGKMIITASGTELGTGIETVIKGYYKVENYKELTGDGMCVQIAPDQGGPSVTADCGWTPFSVNYTTGDSNWVKFGFWFTQGTLSIADITIEDKNGNVIYDMATDTKLVAGTYGADKQPAQLGLWYIGYYGDKSEISCTVGPVYVPPVYTPKRVISMTTAGTQINGKICLYYTGQLGAGKEVTVKGYYKVDNYSAWADRTEGDQNITMAGNVHKADCGWTSFEKTITTGDAHSLCFEFWYAQGTISIADLTVQEVGGDYLYDMTSDADLVAGTYTSANWDAEQSLFYFGFFGNIDAATYTIGDKVDGGIVVIPPPYDPELVELPSIPNLITADPNGYTPNRAFAVINSIHASPKVNYATFATTDDFAVAGNKYYVFLKYAIGELTPINSDAAYGAYIKLNGTDVLNSTAESPNWMDLTDAEGNLFTFDAVEDGDIVSMVFGLNNAKGMFAVADLIIANQNGEIVYSLANDKTMHIETDMRYVSNGYWNADPYVCDKAGPNLFPIQTKIENPYTPNSYVSLTANDKKKGTTAESFLYFRTNELFEAGKTYTITGMFKAQIDKGYNGNANPLLKFSDSGGQAQIVDITNHGTNGNWYPLVAADGSPVTFKGTTVEDWLKVNLYCAYGTVALADLVITDSEGKVVYEMVSDQSLMAVKGEFTGNVAGLGNLMRHALYNNGVGEVYFAEQTTENTELSQQIPTFNESVTIPGGDDDECDHNFVDGECEFCGEPDPDYQPPVDDPCANGHDFVDGYCTRCQEADPDYDPNGPSQTGDESMLFVAALGMFAVAALAVVTLNKKKFIG